MPRCCSPSRRISTAPRSGRGCWPRPSRGKHGWRCGCTGTALPLARLADEHLRAAGQGETAALSALLRAALLAGGAFCGLAWLAGAAAISALVALTLACAVGGNPFAAPNAAAVARQPAAALRALLSSPARTFAAGRLLARGRGWAAAGYLLGQALYDCAATPFRRDRRESAGLHLLLILPAAALCALSPFVPALRCAAALTAFAACAGLLAYAAPSPRAALSLLALAAACLSPWLLPAVRALAPRRLCAVLAAAAAHARGRSDDAARLQRRTQARKARSPCGRLTLSRTPRKIAPTRKTELRRRIKAAMTFRESTAR